MAVARNPITHLPMAMTQCEPVASVQRRPESAVQDESQVPRRQRARAGTQQGAPMAWDGVLGAGPQRFAVGEIVRLVGLVLRPDENGKDGEVVSWDEALQRYGVEFDGKNNAMVKPANLVAAPMDAPLRSRRPRLTPAFGDEDKPERAQRRGSADMYSIVLADESDWLFFETPTKSAVRQRQTSGPRDGSAPLSARKPPLAQLGDSGGRGILITPDGGTLRIPAPVTPKLEQGRALAVQGRQQREPVQTPDRGPR
jgi:hypothetical protein